MFNFILPTQQILFSCHGFQKQSKTAQIFLNMTLFCYPNCKSYLKVFVTGILSVTFISSLYSHLADVKSIQVPPDHEYKAWDKFMMIKKSTGFQISDGIGCRILYNGSFSSTCNSMAIEMANLSSNPSIFNSSNITIYPEWNCAAHTQFTSASIFSLFTNTDDSCPHSVQSDGIF